MNDFVYVGKIVNTHGIRGELRLLSKFSYKKKAFAVGRNIYIGRDKVKETITGYRVHKCFDMITLSGYTNINDVLKYKGALCYALRKDLKLSCDEYLEEDLVGLDVFIDENLCGSVIRLEEITDKNKVLWISYENREVAIPFVPEFVEVQIQAKRVKVMPIEGMLS